VIALHLASTIRVGGVILAPVVVDGDAAVSLVEGGSGLVGGGWRRNAQAGELGSRFSEEPVEHGDKNVVLV
jgi:hypothetical protein